MSGAQAFRAPTQSQGEWAASRARSYGFLAWLFLDGPDTPFLERMLSAEVGADLESLAAGGGADLTMVAGLEGMRAWLRAQAHQPLEQVRQTLAVEETWLFRGIAPGYGPPPPYEAVHRRPGAGADPEILLSLGAFYREAAADPSAHAGERLDHLGMELDFMRFLCAEESRLWLTRQADEAIRYRGIQRRLLTEHVMGWVPAYCRKILAEACAPFFHGAARALAGFLAADAAWVEAASGGAEAPGRPDTAPIG